MGSRGNAKHQQESSIITKGAAKFGSLPNHKGCQCNTMESKAGQSHCTCHQKGVLDIEYLTIHVDAGAMAFTRHKYLPPRLAAETFWQEKLKHTTQHSQVIRSLFVDHLNSVT
jgi:hypothetical protein